MGPLLTPDAKAFIEACAFTGGDTNVTLTKGSLTPEARDNIGNSALALQEYSAKAEQEARKAEAEQITARAIARSMAFR